MVSIALLNNLALSPSHPAIISPIIDTNKLYNRYNNTSPIKTSNTTELNMNWSFEFLPTLASFFGYQEIHGLLMKKFISKYITIPPFVNFRKCFFPVLIRKPKMPNDCAGRINYHYFQNSILIYCKLVKKKPGKRARFITILEKSPED